MKKMSKRMLRIVCVLLAVVMVAGTMYGMQIEVLSSAQSYNPNHNMISSIGALAEGSIPISSRADLERIGNDPNQ